MCGGYSANSVYSTSGGATQPQAVGLCQTSEGPIGCTGSFVGSFQWSCSNGKTESMEAILLLHPDGMSEIAGASDTRGKMDSSGRVLVETVNESKTGRWEAQYSRVPAGGGATKAAGSGRSFEKNTVHGVECTGTFVLR
jgi:hypothetical protein